MIESSPSALPVGSRDFPQTNHAPLARVGHPVHQIGAFFRPARACKYYPTPAKGPVTTTRLKARRVVVTGPREPHG
ncbi:hypothetical protein GCM10010185_01460 [Saccharothrix coeruleofusca]|uniref:Uncharacterized protein n=1 Tax=Saccharothrix coeruleofusca TaxID=33919 RepID=A0A918AGQ0_9PSEU|nr:hypothetical protein GCM10010185_01460 [Saccharothrix coeruleofusca]